MSESRQGWSEIAVDLPLSPREADEIAADDDPEPVEITDNQGRVVAVAHLAVVDDVAKVVRLRWDPALVSRDQALHRLDVAFEGKPKR